MLKIPKSANNDICYLIFNFCGVKLNVDLIVESDSVQTFPPNNLML